MKSIGKVMGHLLKKQRLGLLFDLEMLQFLASTKLEHLYFAFDKLREESDVLRMLSILRTVSSHRKRVDMPVGNEPNAACYERAQKVIEHGGEGEPYRQFLLPLNWLSNDTAIRLRFDWQSMQQGRDFVHYYNRYL